MKKLTVAVATGAVPLAVSAYAAMTTWYGHGSVK